MATCPECNLALGDAELCPECGWDKELAPATVLGSYRLLELLGEGGMGRVYRAEHIRLGRRVALKILRKKFTTNPVAVARFFAEARAVNQISHQNVVEITDFFENANGHNYFVMELLKGEDVAQAMLVQRPLPLLRALDIATQVANALDTVHAAKIVHRDLKPENIYLVTRNNRPDFVKLVDFGVAKLAGSIGDDIKMGTTAQGTIIGTPEYMSPEQAGGRPVDHRTDIYALGIILYEMITGTVPFRANSFGEMVIKHMTTPPRKPSECETMPYLIPDSLEELILDLLAKDADARPQSMKEVEATLREIHDELSPPLEVEEIDGIVDKSVRIRAAKMARVTGREETIPGSLPGSSSPGIPIITPTGERMPSGERAPSSERALSAAGATGERMITGETPPRSKRTAILLISAGALPAILLATYLGTRGDSRGASAAAPPPPPTAPTESIIRFTSKPAGAVVHLEGNTEILGTTPFTHRFPREARDVVYVFERPGSVPESQEVSLNRDAMVSVVLEAVPPVAVAAPVEPPKDKKKHGSRSKPAKTETKKTFDRGSTMDVFE